MTTRAEFLARIRREIGKTVGLFPAAVAERPADPAEAAAAIRRQLAERWPEALERFRHEFERVGGVFHRVASVRRVSALVGALARERSASRLVTWHPTALGADLTAECLAEGLDTEAMPPGEVGDEGERRRLREVVARADLGLTGADLAVAETGSLILRSGPGRPRSTSLLPPCHVALFDAGALVESLAQVGVFLEAWQRAGDGGGAVINFITGPSRTADIELTLTRGVHGPKEVHAVFVERRIGG